MNFAQTIADLNTQLAAANGKITTITGERDSLVTANQEFDGRHKADTLKITELQGQVTIVTKERDVALATIADPQGFIQKEVVSRVSAAGTDPIARVQNPEKTSPSPSKTEGASSPEQRLSAGFQAKIKP